MSPKRQGAGAGRRASAAAASVLLTYGAAWERLIDDWFIFSLPIA